MRRTIAPLALLTALVLAGSGCALLSTNKTKIRISHVLTDPSDKKSPRDRFVEIQGKTGDQSRDPFGIAVTPWGLWAPFTLEATVGIFDPSAREATLGATACLELHEEDAIGLSPLFVCADFFQGVTQVSASVEDSLVQEHFVVVEVELQIEADGTNLHFRSRERDAETWTDVASMPYTQSVGLLPSISARNLFKKGRVGFDEFVVDAQGVAPDPPSDADLFVGHIQTAVQREYDACAALDGATIDFEAAALDLDEAMLSLHAARDQLQLLTETAETRKAGKRLSQTEKKTQSALAKIGKRKEEPAIKRIQQAIRRAVEASLLIEPRNL